MIAGDEGKPMSILELISDEPRDARPFVDYLLKWQREYREATWGGRPDDELVPVGCVTIQIDTLISCLESLAMKMDREAAEHAQVGSGNPASPEHSVTTVQERSANEQLTT